MGINDRTSYENPRKSQGWAGLPGVQTAKKVSFEGSRLACNGIEHIIAEDDGIPIEDQGMLVIVEDQARQFFLSPPRAGCRAAGGDDGKQITIISATPHPHAVQLTAPERINGRFSTITFSEPGSMITMVAGKGTWFPITTSGVTLK